MLSLHYDLHIHSCLSPCGDDDMTPANIVGMAALKGLDVIAITDHNSCRNAAPAIIHGRSYGVTVIPGMELTTAEEVHVLCLFEHLEDALQFDAYVYERLLPIRNKVEIFGNQFVMDQEDKVIGEIENLLINATSISFDSVNRLLHQFHGFMIPAHIDKNANSLISNLGFVPPDSSFLCAELKSFENLHHLRAKNPYLNQCKIISDSDAHYLQDINEPINTLYAKSKAIQDIFSALQP